MARKKSDEEDEVVDTVTVIFTSLSVILLAFFILMSTMGTVDSEHSKKAIGSLLGTFGSIPGGFSTNPNGGILNVNFMALSDEDTNQMSSTVSKLIDANGLEGDLDVSINKDNLIFNFEDKIIFKEGTAEIKQEAYTVLNDLITRFSSSNKIISVESHVDPESYKNTHFNSDWEFAYERGLAIINYFVQQGFPEKRLNLACYGSHKPIRPNDTDEGRSRNRRIEFIVLKGTYDQNLRPKVKTVEIKGFKFEQPIDNK